MIRRFGCGLLCGVVFVAGAACDDAQPVSKNEKSQTVVVAPATGPATTQATAPIPAVFLLEGVDAVGATTLTPVRFPAARLVLTEKGGVVRALLFSDDPPESLQRTYHGNSFYFDMELAIASKGSLLDADYSFDASSDGDLADTPNGLFLDGDNRALMPRKLNVRFVEADGQTVVLLAGEFVEERGATRITHPVKARLIPTVKMK